MSDEGKDKLNLPFASKKRRPAVVVSTMKRKGKVHSLMKIKLGFDSFRGVKSNGAEILAEQSEDCFTWIGGKKKKMFN
jgi:hypothetical protein